MVLKILLILLVINGVGMTAIWTADIFTNRDIDLSPGFFNARDKDSGNLFWPHWLAEYATAILLIAAPVLIFLKMDVGAQLVPFGAGALFYTSLNSLSWAFARKERFAYAAPMLFGLAVSFAYFMLLLLT